VQNENYENYEIAQHKNNVLKSQITKSDLISHIWDYIPNVILVPTPIVSHTHKQNNIMIPKMAHHFKSPPYVGLTSL